MAKVMLVEDDNNLREIYGARLQAEGHDIVAAKDGEEALALAVKEKPELIISDVMMPRISGFDMLDILRNAPETKDTKVIMMTALSQAEDKSRADKLGADRYLVKSQVTLEDVANVVREVLEGTPEGGAIAPEETGLPDSLAAAATSNDAPAATPTPAAVAPAPEPAPTVDAIANPVVEVHDEPDPSQVQAPPTEEPQTEAVTPATPEPTPVAAEPVVNATPVAEPVTTTAPEPVTTTAPADDTVAPVVTDDAAAAALQAASDAVAAAIPAADPVAASAPDPSSTPVADVSTPTVPAPEPPVAVTAEPAETQPVEAPEPEPAPIKVELPSAAQTTPAEPTTSPIPTPVATPAPAPEPEPAPVAEDTSGDNFVGPNLAEALASEEDSSPSNSDQTDSITEPPVPVVSNGTPSTVVVEPTPAAPAPEPEPIEEPEPEKPAEETTNTGVSSGGSTNTAAGMKVIKPLSDPSAQPDINDLLAAEERKAAVENPVANTIITPGTPAGSSTEAAPKKPDEDNPVNNIAL